MAAATLATGAAGPWIGALLRAEADVGHALNLSPSALIGPLWIPVGLVLAGILVAMGRLGWASLAASPYVLPYYLLFGLLEFVRPRPDQVVASSSTSRAASAIE